MLIEKEIGKNVNNRFWFIGIEPSSLDTSIENNPKLSGRKSLENVSVLNPMFMTKNFEYASNYAMVYKGFEVLVEIDDSINVCDITQPEDFKILFPNITNEECVVFAELFKSCEPYFSWNMRSALEKKDFSPIEFTISRLVMLYRHSSVFGKSKQEIFKKFKDVPEELDNSKLTQNDKWKVIKKIYKTANKQKELVDFIMNDQFDNINFGKPISQEEYSEIRDLYDKSVFFGSLKKDKSGNYLRDPKTGAYQKTLYKDVYPIVKKNNEQNLLINPDRPVSSDKEIGFSKPRDKDYYTTQIIEKTIPPSLTNEQIKNVNTYLKFIERLHSSYVSGKNGQSLSQKIKDIESKISELKHKFNYQYVDKLQWIFYNLIANKQINGNKIWDGVYAPEVKGAESMGINSLDTTIYLFDSSKIKLVDIYSKNEVKLILDKISSGKLRNGEVGRKSKVLQTTQKEYTDETISGIIKCIQANRNKNKFIREYNRSRRIKTKDELKSLKDSDPKKFFIESEKEKIQKNIDSNIRLKLKAKKLDLHSLKIKRGKSKDADNSDLDAKIEKEEKNIKVFNQRFYYYSKIITLLDGIDCDSYSLEELQAIVIKMKSNAKKCQDPLDVSFKTKDGFHLDKDSSLDKDSFIQKNNNSVQKTKISGIWLDDMRNPKKYFLKKAESSETFKRNKNFYDNFFKNYDVDFKWVKNYDEFKTEISLNGLPEFVSFDYDLGKGLKKGSECAKFLVNYCKENNKKLPEYFIHSANPNGLAEIGSILSFAEKDIGKEDLSLKISIYEPIQDNPTIQSNPDIQSQSNPDIQNTEYHKFNFSDNFWKEIECYIYDDKSSYCHLSEYIKYFKDSYNLYLFLERLFDKYSGNRYNKFEYLYLPYKYFFNDAISCVQRQMEILDKEEKNGFYPLQLPDNIKEDVTEYYCQLDSLLNTLLDMKSRREKEDAKRDEENKKKFDFIMKMINK